MNLLIRLLFVVAVAGFGSRRPLLSPSRLRLCVFPNDLDLNLHMNNGRYPSVFDLGKMDVMIRSGVAAVAYRHGWRPLIGGNVTRHRFGLGPFHRFHLVTRVLCWDAKWFYFEHHVETKRGIAAVGLSKALLHDRARSISTDEVLAALDARVAPPPVPNEVAEWILLDEMLRVGATGDKDPERELRLS